MTTLKLLTRMENRLTITFVALVLGAFTLAGCDSIGSSNDGAQINVGFGSTSSSSTASVTTGSKADHSISVDGTNGTLTITDIRLIVSEVELDGDADSSEFEMDQPQFVDLPLNSSDVVSVVTGQVAPGTYNEFDFEVDDATLDDGDDEEELQALRDDIDNAGFTDWPNQASMVVVGSFTPTDGNAQNFTTYVDAEIEVEIEMGQGFEVGGDNPARGLTVSLSPSRWFVSNGDPLDLSADQYQNVDEPVELEIDFEQESEIDFDD